MAPPLYPVSFYNFYQSDNPGWHWSPSLGGLHLDFFCPGTVNSFDPASYHCVIGNPRFPEAVSVLDQYWASHWVSKPGGGYYQSLAEWMPTLDWVKADNDTQRYSDPAFCVARMLIFAGDPANLMHDLQNPYTLFDPMEWLFQMGPWVRGTAAGSVPGYDPARGRVAGVTYYPEGGPGGTPIVVDDASGQQCPVGSHWDAAQAACVVNAVIPPPGPGLPGGMMTWLIAGGLAFLAAQLLLGGKR